MPEVYSSTVDTADYEIATKRLIVKWKRGGKTSVYENVPPELGFDTVNSWSVGQAIHQNIKGRYDHRYID